MKVPKTSALVKLVAQKFALWEADASQPDYRALDAGFSRSAPPLLKPRCYLDFQHTFQIERGADQCQMAKPRENCPAPPPQIPPFLHKAQNDSHTQHSFKQQSALIELFATRSAEAHLCERPQRVTHSPVA
jgi:hypothetical protein